ncbi:MAG: hypothetical protein AB1689_26855, partial [Thermodesulfobacteriota bacterium]
PSTWTSGCTRCATATGGSASSQRTSATRRCCAAGCAGCLGKPIDTRALPDQLTRFLRGAPALAS